MSIKYLSAQVPLAGRGSTHPIDIAVILPGFPHLHRIVRQVEVDHKSL